MLEYRQTLRVKGGSEIERQIAKHTKLGISRKTIENWLNDPESQPNSQTLKIVLRFLQTAHFQKIVPRTRDYLESDARLCRIGDALFDLYGSSEMDSIRLEEINTRVAGWWVGLVFKPGDNPEASYLYIAPVAGHPFSKIQLMLYADDFPRGSGIAFPKTDEPQCFQYAARIWARDNFRERALVIWCREKTQALPAHLVIMYEPRLQASPPPGNDMTLVTFYRIGEEAVPATTRSMFDQWSGEVLPRDLAGQTVIR
jgi:hypothetical protein